MHIQLQRPLVTEKAMGATKSNYYGFLVNDSATKTQIKAAVQTMFGVKVTAVKTVKNAGKTKRVGKMRRATTTAQTKKAFVKLAQGQSLDVVPTMPEEVKK